MLSTYEYLKKGGSVLYIRDFVKNNWSYFYFAVKFKIPLSPSINVCSRRKLSNLKTKLQYFLISNVHNNIASWAGIYTKQIQQDVFTNKLFQKSLQNNRTTPNVLNNKIWMNDLNENSFVSGIILWNLRNQIVLTHSR